MYSIITKPVQDIDCTFIQIHSGEIDVTLMNYGAAIYELNVPDKNGHYENVVLQYQDLEQYIGNKRHANATIGPTAGRIKDGTFTVGNITVQLDKNYLNRHTLHGGADALSYTLFDYHLIEEESQTQVIFKTAKKSMYQKYPGNQEYQIIYTIKGSQITIAFVAKTDTPTLINLTNHAYFNLSGNLQSTILQHQMQINASRKLSLDADMLPFGIENIHGTIYDYTTLDTIEKPGFIGVDDPYLLDTTSIEQVAATLIDPVSKRRLDVYTTYPCIVCYTDNFPQTDALAYNRTNIPHMGVCFETQNPPDGIHLDGVEKSIVEPQQSYYHKTIFKFGLE